MVCLVRVWKNIQQIHIPKELLLGKKNWAEKIESGEMEGKDAIVAFYEKQLAEAKLEVMALSSV